MIDHLNYKRVSKLDMLDPKRNIIKKMNLCAFLSILVLSVIGVILNYVFRSRGMPGGTYFLIILAGAFNCVIYVYLHEFVHALAIILIKREKPQIKFEKLTASCGSRTMVFTKGQYVFVASAPFAFFIIILIPVLIFAPAMLFPLAFMPLCYNFFGSFGDIYMIRHALSAPKYSVVIDAGTEIDIYIPTDI